MQWRRRIGRMSSLQVMSVLMRTWARAGGATRRRSRSRSRSRRAAAPSAASGAAHGLRQPAHHEASPRSPSMLSSQWSPSNGRTVTAPSVAASRQRTLTLQPSGMRARNVERLDAAHRAEQVARGAGVEAVVGEHVVAFEQPEAVGLDDQMQVAGAPAHRAVAVDRLDVARVLRPRTARGRSGIHRDA